VQLRDCSGYLLRGDALLSEIVCPEHDQSSIIHNSNFRSISTLLLRFLF
jgi:hypothetical protein